MSENFVVAMFAEGEKNIAHLKICIYSRDIKSSYLPQKT